MCGITCIIDKRGEPVGERELQQANRALAHRGPDDSSVYTNAQVGLGHSRLSIVDLEAGHQPFFNETQSVILIANGEIYGFEDLRAKLKEKGHQFRSRCDSEVIVHLYEEDPERYVERLDGMFAFVLLDTKRGCVHFARDRVGIKPLFKYEDERRLILSSEIKGILATGLAKPELDSQAIFDSFTFGYIPGPKTAFRNIEHVSPATNNVVALHPWSLSSRCYWAPQFPLKEKSNKGLLKLSRQSDRFRDLLREAVSSHVIGDVPLSSYLSGGIDSTATTLLLRDELEEVDDLRVFSIKFQEEGFDESSVFERTISDFNLDSSILSLPGANCSDFRTVVRAIEQPQFSPIDIPLLKLAELVRSQGRKVVFSGEGSDEMLGGYSAHILNQVRRAVSMPALSGLRAPLLEKALKYFIASPELRQKVGATYSESPERTTDVFGLYPAWYPFWRARSEMAGEIFEGEHEGSLKEDSSMAQLSRCCAAESVGVDDFNRSLHLELKTRLPHYILHRADRISMAHAVEVRVPFLDNDVLQFALELPPIFKMFGLKEKYILRKAFRSLLPSYVVKRRKHGFDAPREWLFDGEDDLREEMLSEQTLKRVGLFSPSRVREYRTELDQSRGLRGDYRSEMLRDSLTGVLSTQLLYHEYVSG